MKKWTLKDIQCMLQITPLQLSKNVFLPETAEDLDQFYGLDRLSQNKSQASNISERAPLSYSLPTELASRCSSLVIELNLKQSNSGVSLKNFPASAHEIVVYPDSNHVHPLKQGQICIVSPNNSFPKAFYKPFADDMQRYRERDMIDENSNDIFSDR